MKNDRWRYATGSIEAVVDGGVSMLTVSGYIALPDVEQAVASNARWLDEVGALGQIIDIRAMSAGFTARQAFDAVRLFVARGRRTGMPTAFIVPGGVMRPVTVYCLLMAQLGVSRAAFQTPPEALAWVLLRLARPARTRGARTATGSSASLV